jgi:hypothetical protein
MSTWSEVSARQPRRDLPYLLAMAVLVNGDIVDQEEVAKGVADAWTMPEWPGLALDYSVWGNLFGEALGAFDDCYLTDDGEVQSREDLPETLVLYRGAAAGHEDGMAWTTNLDRATWFATRFNGQVGGVHTVRRIEVDRDAVLAVFHRRGEDEYVLDPGLIEDYEVTEVQG